jgi:two-component system phosphate regulon sensor histidine kinase PhoR
LIFNAVRHTPAGTKIDVRWEGDDEQAILTVSDQGEGIAEHHLPRLTDRFYRVDPSRSRSSGGTGLGLAIVKQILDRYGADLHIDSKLGHGTAFSCRFPEKMVQIVEIAAEKNPARNPRDVA